MCGIRASHFGRGWAPLPNPHRWDSASKIWNNTKCLVKISPVDEQGSLTFYTRVHHRGIGPILISKNHDEMKPCIPYVEAFSGVSEDGAF